MLFVFNICHLGVQFWARAGVVVGGGPGGGLPSKQAVGRCCPLHCQLAALAAYAPPAVHAFSFLKSA